MSKGSTVLRLVIQYTSVGSIERMMSPHPGEGENFFLMAQNFDEAAEPVHNVEQQHVLCTYVVSYVQICKSIQTF